MKIKLLHLLILLAAFWPRGQPLYLMLDVRIDGQKCWAYIKVSDTENTAELACPCQLSTTRELHLTKSSVAKTPDLKFYQIKTGFYRLEKLENGHYKIIDVKVERVDPDYLILD